MPDGRRHHSRVPGNRPEAAQQMGGEAQRRAIVRGDSAGGRRPRLDLVQRAGQQAAFGQQGVDRGKAERHGALAGPLGAMGTLQPADPLAQIRGTGAASLAAREATGGAKALGEMTGIAPSIQAVERVGDKCSLFVLIRRSGESNGVGASGWH